MPRFVPVLVTLITALLGIPGNAFAQKSDDPDLVCASCHRDIYTRYARTPMAQASGAAVDGLIQGGFRHAPSGIDYRVFLRNDQAWLSFDRAATATQPALKGERQLIYYIGSGQQGRTYLYQELNRWFEAPINYYARKQIWDMAPAYGASASMPSLIIDSNCLHCHTTGVASALPQARNLYAGAPFRQSGIGCSACHGDPSAHLATQGHGPIVNPGKLTAQRRDSICLECHLEGDAAVFRANTSPASFRPGDDLDSYAIFFVKASAQSGGGRAASQYESLLRSACKAGTGDKPGAGDKLTCTTCHDPHAQPSAAERVAYYRAKCLNCHSGGNIATQHHPEQQDCAACHMPARNTTDIPHNEGRDHNIQRDASSAELHLEGLQEETRLIPVGSAIATDRSLGLAYAQLAERGDRSAAVKAIALLQSAEAAGVQDAPVHVQLGFLEQRAGDMARARTEYEAALRIDPYEVTAMGNLAVLEARSGEMDGAMKLLQRVIDADPTQIAAGLNLALMQCKQGDKQTAFATLQLLSRFSPDDPMLKQFRDHGKYAEQTCSVQ
jgi:tetratricopeptide (TPR) repeat protein